MYLPFPSLREGFLASESNIETPSVLVASTGRVDSFSSTVEMSSLDGTMDVGVREGSIEGAGT